MTPRPRRTIRKPTRWTADEWARVEDAARARGVPPLRYVREAALGAPPAPKRYHRDELTRQLGRVLNNLRQLHTVAVDDWADAAAARIQRTIRVTEAAIRSAPAPGTTAAEAVQVIVVAGRALNELAHRGNADEGELPPDAELLPALEAVEASFSWIFR
ncbi:MAG TPA: hypothetical protein VFS20_22745 [Longimicrobium sp.]|nr:hypothetical protein [Longimicrobium sp.]